MSIKLNELNGHDKDVVARFNKVAEYFDTYGLLDIILSNWCDDSDLKGITDCLENRLLEDINQ